MAASYLGIIMGNQIVRTGMRLLLIVTLVACVLFMGIHGVARPVEHPAEGHATLPPEQRLDINSASVEELLTIPGMTRTWAGRIVRFRPYHSRDDLVLRGVVTSQVYDRIKGCVIAHREKQ
jgi:DNA uptake protein ComE-like DNA-binding protein